MKSYNLTFSQCRVLGYVERSGGKATQKQIEEYLQVSHPTVVGLLSRLKENGFIECKFDCEYGKNKVVTLTAKAEAFSKQMKNSHKKSEETLLSGFSEAEKAQLERMLLLMWENVQKAD